MPSFHRMPVMSYYLEELERKRIGTYKQIFPSDTLLGIQKSRQIAGIPFVCLQAHAVPTHTLRLKRLLDLVYFFLSLPISLPLLLSITIYARSRVGVGVFYQQERTGHLGIPFTIWKFRTMPLNVEDETGALLASNNDPRVLKGMRWLRRTRLDELPQLWNIFKGEMSIVGPRPERPIFVEKFQREIPGYERRHDMVPGLTGLAQVQAYYQTDPSFKLGHDLQYIVNWSPVLDLQILLKTIVVAISKPAQ